MSPDPLKLSVVIPCYNEKDTVEALLDAVHASPITNKEIVLVDDFSTDGTRDLLQGPLKSKIDTWGWRAALTTSRSTCSSSLMPSPLGVNTPSALSSRLRINCPPAAISGTKTSPPASFTEAGKVVGPDPLEPGPAARLSFAVLDEPEKDE